MNKKILALLGTLISIQSVQVMAQDIGLSEIVRCNGLNGEYAMLDGSKNLTVTAIEAVKSDDDHDIFHAIISGYDLQQKKYNLDIFDKVQYDLAKDILAYSTDNTRVGVCYDTNYKTLFVGFNK
ncbi:hypothetical protein HPX47_004776 [Vibrio alginolyticus]|nr:hypothetical protein [Vibrio alginolyticus]